MKGKQCDAGLVIKPSNIRIWLHQRDLGKLQQVLWEGYGAKLRTETSNNPRMKRLLEAVPHIMGLIKTIHISAVTNDLDMLKERTADPVPPIILTSKDSNGLNVLHKAAGLGYNEVVDYIISRCPKALQMADGEGRTPLHYAAVLKDGGQMYSKLLEAGAEESALDNKQKTAAYYKTRQNDIDTKVLQVIPDAPRTASDSFPSTWDWNLLTATTPEEYSKPIIKKPVGENFFGQQPEKDAPKQEVLNNEIITDDTTEVIENGDTGKEIEENGNAVNVNDNQNGNVDGENVEEVDKENNESIEQESKIELVEDESKPELVKQESKPELVKQESKPELIKQESQYEDKQGSVIETTAELVDQNGNETEQNGDVNGYESDTENGTENKETGEKIIANNSENEDEDVVTECDKPNAVSEVVAEENNKTENENDGKHEAEDSENEGVIEGIVNGENEVETLNNEENDENVGGKRDEEVLEMIESGNMEQLAALVLNGEGERLVGYQSDNQEIRAFLENVPVYMSKINRIHMAAKDGNLKELQAALDRRKFAVAKDNISPNGASPLHVATVFGNTSIVRYLAGRFPETVQVEDNNGRTPLHYAATIADNGHYYNLLLHLGGNAKAEDKFGHTAEYYKTNPEEFSHKSLLREFGADEEMADEMLNDKVPDDKESSRRDLDDQDMLAILDRCYKLLHGRRESNAVSAGSLLSTYSISMSNLPSKYLKRFVYDAIKLRVTRLDYNFYDVIWPSVKKLPQDPTFRAALEDDFPAGVVAPDYYAYKVFQEFFIPLVKDINAINATSELYEHPLSSFGSHVRENEAEEENDSKSIQDFELDLDSAGKYVLNTTLGCCRNLEQFELPISLNTEELEDVERLLTTELINPETARILCPKDTVEELEEKGNGTYYTMNEVLEESSEVRLFLAAAGLLIPLWNIGDSDRLHGKYWPYGRGVFVSSSGDLAVWINVLDHVRIITCAPNQQSGDVGVVYSRVCRLMNKLEKKLSFKRDKYLGFLSARPSSLGNTLQFNMTVRFPYLIKEPDNLRHLCTVRGLKYKEVHHASGIVRIGNQQCLGITEIQTFEDFTTAVSNILQLEKDLAMSNSMHIAAMFINMFRRKKASLSAASDY